MEPPACERGAACAEWRVARQRTTKNRSQVASRHLEAARGAHGAPPTCRSRAPARKRRGPEGPSGWQALGSSTLAPSGEIEVATSSRARSCISSELVHHPVATGSTLVSQKRPRKFALGRALSGAARHRADARAAGLTGLSLTNTSTLDTMAPASGAPCAPVEAQEVRSASACWRALR